MPEYQSSNTSLQRGPSTASDFSRERSSGNKPRRFSSSTIDFCVTVRTKARVDSSDHGVRSRSLPMRECAACAGGSSKAEPEHHAKDPAQGAIELRLTQQAALDGLRERLEIAIEKLIDARSDAGRRGRGQVGKCLVITDQQPQPAPVTADDAIETPLFAHHLVQHRVGVSGNAVDLVVGGHQRARAALPHRPLERARVVFAKGAWLEVGRGVRATVLVAVGTEVLEQGRRQPGPGALLLQPARERHGQCADVKRIFAIHLLGPAPARIAS